MLVLLLLLPLPVIEVEASVAGVGSRNSRRPSRYRDGPSTPAGPREAFSSGMEVASDSA